MTCTSLPKVWDKGSLRRNPGAVRDTQYDSFKINVKRRAYFDPRPTSRQTSDITQEQINTLLFDLMSNPEVTLFQKHLQMKYPQERYSPLDLKYLSINCRNFINNIPSLQNSYQVYFHTNEGEKIYELPQTEGQRKSKQWQKYRSIYMTGTAAYSALHLSSVKAKKNFLRNHLWGLDIVQTKAMIYGVENEEKALDDYEKKRQKTDNTAAVAKDCGILNREDFPEAAASVDAITFSQNFRPRLVEVKCPYILRNHHPTSYKKVLKQSQRNSFCLGYSKERGNYLKKGSPYYSQVQHYLGLLGLEVCDFVVWSKKGTLIVEVKFDKEHWNEIKSAVLEVYWNLSVPEYF
ncbi:hypothetical protein KUF71_023324 [Frankliniella fusca]|uniref:YqaJ viral recombinase domain-containing protein n=1 Tax=Frankliniella fusca TaxID=407009 RepID=A0AAE1H471_9NEOP|nr:hypothetical protein KUF71_023324 [Frankliniella fusca]